MFQARLAYDDLGSPVDLIGGGVFMGGSSVLPVRHRLLRTLVLESRDRVAILSLERFPDDPEGLEAEAGLSEAALEARLGALGDYLLDYALLLIDRRARAVHYRASPIVSVPVYLLAEPGSVSIDWDYSRLLAGRRARIVWDVALAQIAGRPAYGPRTMVEGVQRATAGATLTASAAGIEARLPEPVSFDGPRDVPAGTDVEGKLFDTVRALLAARPLEPGRTALELSGGMDSALTSLAAADLLGPGLMSVGAQFGGAMGEAQRERRLLLCDRGGFDDLSVPAERFAPFSTASLRRIRHGVWPEDENYPEIFEALFGMLRAAGIDALVSGFGGDELYFAYRGEGEEDRGSGGGGGPAPFLTEAGLAAAAEPRPPYPRSWLQESCWQSAAGQSQRLLRYGLWPVYPYHNPALARFVSRLPYDYRRDRRLLRKLLTRLLGDALFETDYVKESFDPVALRGLAENRDYLADLVRRSPLSRHPAIDDSALLAALARDPADLERDTYNALFRTLKIFCFFQTEE